MSNHRTVPAGNGVTWLVEAARLVFKNPAAFLLMGLIYTIIAALPILGMLALSVISPALYAGLCHAARTQDQGGNAEVAHLFQGFTEQGRMGPLLILCLPGIVAGVLAVVLLLIWVGVALAGAGASALLERPEALVGSMGVGAILLLLLLLALMLAVFAITFFAIPAVMFGQKDAFEAMRRSLRASLANVGTLLVYLLVIFVGSAVVVGVVSLISSLLAQFLISIVFTPIFGASMYLAWKDIFGDEVTKQTPELPDSSGDGGMVA